MPSTLAMSLMQAAEFALWAMLLLLFWKKDLRRRFPAMGAYLLLRLGTCVLLTGLFQLQALPWGHRYFYLYFFTYWISYIASAVILFLVCIEVFRSVLSSFSGLTRLGTLAFRWVTLISMIVSAATIVYQSHGVPQFVDVAYGLMRAVSLLELCLLGFVCLCMNALNITHRDMTFGISLGLGMMAANDLVTVSLLSRYTSLTSPIQFVYEGIFLAVVGMWIVYCVLPEPVRKPVVLAPDSTIYRWNEIAAALGHGTKVAVQQPANSFFLSDVEKVVDKVLTRTNLQGNETK